MKIFYSIIGYIALSVLITSCKRDEYDPIGNNKPVQVLKVLSKWVAIPGTGGEVPFNVNTNVENIGVVSLVPWLKGVFHNNSVTLTSAANPDDAVRESFVTVSTQTGKTEAQATVRVIQGNSGTKNTFVDMFRTNLTNEWKVLKANGEWTIADNALRTNSPGDVQSVLAYQKAGAETIRSSTREFRLSVDVANPGNWSGVVFHATDDKNFFYIGLNINPTSLFVIVDRIFEGNGSPMAMDPGNVLSEDRSPYLRCEIVTVTTKPNEFTLNIYELKNSGDIAFNTDLAVVQKVAYSRTFNSNLMAGGGYAGVWGKVGGGNFRRFVLTSN